MGKWNRNSCCGPGLRTLFFCLACFYWNAIQGNTQDIAPQAEPIVLRDLSLIRGKTVSDFDDASITLSDGTRLTWDQILKARVPGNRQTEFDLKLQQLGLPLFRLKTRIGNGDWIGAGEISGAIYDSSIAHGKAPADVDTEYLVCLATMKNRMGQSNRAGAIMPFLRAAQLQSDVSASVLEMVGTRGIPPRDQELGLSRELLPIWFDNSGLEDTARQLRQLLKAPTADNGPPPQPGLTVYLASLMIELGQTEEALSLLRSLKLDSDAELDGWQTVLEARIHQKTNNGLDAQTILELDANKITGTARPVSLYYRGINVGNQQGTSDLDRSKAILTLLRIPALYGSEYRDLSAAAIYQAAEIAELRERTADAQKLRDELLRRYPRTYHGRLETNQRAGRL